jgi:ParB family chromosome partitioning protein
MAIDIGSLVISNHNMRSTHDGGAMETEYLKLLAENIATYGLLHPLTVHPLGDGTFEVLAGQRRLHALRSLGWTSVPCTVLEDVSNPLAISFSENMQRNNMLKRDTCRIIGQLANDNNNDLIKVARLMQLTLPTVKRYAAISRLDDATLARLDSPGEDHLTLQAAEKLLEPSTSTEDGDSQAIERKERKKPVKSEPWIYNDEHKPVSIPESLHAKVLALVTRANAAN